MARLLASSRRLRYPQCSICPSRYGLLGASTWTLAGETIEIGPGDAACIPRGIVHGFANRGSVGAKFLAIASPGVFGAAYFREVGEILAAAAGGPPDRVALADAMRRHGLTPAAASI